MRRWVFSLIGIGVLILFGLLAAAITDRPSTYLILVQNNHELRATGGFIAAVGRLTLDRGRINDLTFNDSYDIYRQETDYPTAPLPMQQYMGIPYLTLRDANWSPDLPTTAEFVRAIYGKDTGQTFDGLITIDLNAVKLLIDGLGSLSAPGVDTPLTGDNAVAQMTKLWAQPADSDVALGSAELGDWWEQRKEFIPRLAQAGLRKLKNGDVNYLTALAAMVTALNRRDIQVVSAGKATAAIADWLGWNGALKPQIGRDYLAVVDTNMGYNKVDAVIDRSLAYTVTWPHGTDQPAQATLALTYQHPLDVIDEGCDLSPRYGADYKEMTERCYFDYVRIYTPAGSELLSSDGFESGSMMNQRGEKGTRIFSGYFVLPPNRNHTITFTYTLPPQLTPDDYSLVLQRQSGTDALPIHLSVGGASYTETLVKGRLDWSPP